MKEVQKSCNAECSCYNCHYSPSINRRYVFAVFDNKEEHRESIKTQGTKSCLSLGTKADKITYTFNHFIKLVKGERDLVLSDNEIIDTTAVLVDNGVQ